MAGNYLPELLLAAALVAGVSAVQLSYSDYPPPLQQVRDGGVSPEDVQCNAGLVHAVRANGDHVCVKETTAERLGWEVFADEEAAPAGGAARNAPSPAESAGDGRAAEVTTPPKPPASVQAPAEGEAVKAEDSPSADGSPETTLRDPRYYMADNKITLQGVENKLPNLTGFWMPITKEEAEQAVMPRLAAAIGDTLILPERTGYEICVELLLPDCSRFLDGPDPDSLSYYPYDTENGNSFMAWKASEQHPDLISSIRYRMYEWVPYEEREEFFRSFMEKAGFYGAKVDIVDTNGVIYGAIVSAHLEFLADHRGPFMQLNFHGWTNEYHLDDRLPEGLLLPREEVTRRAHAFAAAHADLWDGEKCALELKGLGKSAGITSRFVKAGVPLYDVVVGNCYNPDNPGSVSTSQSIVVEATEGEIMWPSYLYYLAEDWADRIDIPEHAKLYHNGNYNENDESP